MSDDAQMSKGILDSIKGMLGRRPKTADSGPSAQASAQAKGKPAAPAAPTQPKLSGRAEDHAHHAEGLTHLLQTNPGVKGSGAMTAAITHLRTAHEHMQKARAAYDKGDHLSAHRMMLGAKAYHDHALAAHERTVHFHGDVLRSRMTELSGALNAARNPDAAAGHRALQMAKADGPTGQSMVMGSNPYAGMVRGLHRSR